MYGVSTTNTQSRSTKPIRALACQHFGPTSARAKETNKRLVAAALELDGTCIGEHGVGIGKMHNMLAEHGESGIALMRAIKHSMDPHGILNPGKVLP